MDQHDDSVSPFPCGVPKSPKNLLFGIRRVWDHQLMGPAGAFMTLWSHIGVGHGPNSGVVSKLEGDVPSHLISTLVYRDTYQLYFLPWTRPLLHQMLCLNNLMDLSMVSRDRWSHRAVGSHDSCRGPFQQVVSPGKLT